MASQGPLLAGTGADDATVGTVAWATPTRIVADDSSMATASIVSANTTSHYLVSSSHGFSIPTGATIDGIIVEIQHRSGGTSVAKDNRVRIVKGGAIGSTDKADATNWPTAETTVTYGTSSDLWGTTWTAADINASNFGAAVSAIWVSGTNAAGVDFIRITVHYTAAASATFEGWGVTV